ncbi:aldehyde dehydrogenase [Burkholderia stagnalis]|uniref:Aldehyde dehydrogenase n=1 Tax=Burkholderia stagnalis TaxID=1503054 RepID=A0A6L3MYA6_9BURK|nr:coniferyl aldehyde dehydrogenase [Burkholderia stagnalis]KAB0637815.1 coniferyl aldehyde dehydrogenase [Burkholderia stagnalis]KVO48698.1 aldehyde dehydrogenase [Burkholderia stagnalis]KVO82106.1 aldehyde dehydrogenase [Burkholderia stagnalis]KVW57945.1 aldehyde dehydrogenase [Burkholderia stagnalis]KVW88156.1 aldehyde dehydrogenase [Burkholderia stagnalis]
MFVSAESSSSIDPAALLARQRSAFVKEGPPGVQQRKARLARLRAAVLAHRRDVEEAISADFGHRSRHETAIMELVGVIQAIDYLSRNLRRFMKPQRRHVGIFYRAGHARVEYQPVGVVGVMAPWNYPFSLTFIPLATALAAGNRAMLKPSELTPRTSEVIRRMLADTFPSEEVAVVLGGPEVGAAFSGLPFDHLLFTGSTQVGRKVMKAASDNLVPVTLELGGKSPVIVARGHVDARTMSGIVFGKLSNGGQTCVAPDYALVHEEDLDAFVAQYDAAVARFYPDGPTSQDYTSIVSDRHFDRLKGLVDEARSKGARVIEAGVNPQNAANRKRTLAPTLIVGAGDDTAVMQEEIFGPILPVRAYRTIDEVIDYVNARPRPLALYYFGARDGDCETLLTRTTSGNVGINNTLLHVAQEDLPFGGVGPSGMGAYHGIEGFRAMSHAKGVFVQGRWALPNLLRAPFGKLADFSLAALLGPSRQPAGGRVEWDAKR